MQTSTAVLVSFAAFFVVTFVIALIGRRVHLVRQLSAPLILAALAGALKLYTSLGAAKPEALLKAASWALVFAPIAFALRLAALYFFDYHLKLRRAVTLPTMISGVAVWTAYFITALAVFKLLYPDTPLTYLAATSAVTSLVLGLALQPILTNFFAGLVITAERPFRINDWIKVGETEGRVTAITWRTTHLRTRDNDNLIIPNSKLAEDQLLNYYLPHNLHMLRIYVGAHYSSPPYRVRRVMVDSVRGLDGVLETPTTETYVVDFADSAITYELRIWVADIANAPRISSDARSRLWEAFRQHGIAIPYPIRTLEVAPRPPRRHESEIPPAHLFVAEGPDRGKSLNFTGGPITVGRSRTCELALTDPQASKEHLRIEWSGSGYVLADLGSSFGTKVNGEAVTARPLGDLDRISLGDSVIVFERDA